MISVNPFWLVVAAATVLFAGLYVGQWLGIRAEAARQERIRLRALEAWRQDADQERREAVRPRTALAGYSAGRLVVDGLEYRTLPVAGYEELAAKADRLEQLEAWLDTNPLAVTAKSLPLRGG